jgi:lysophospholipase L1-like esterase
MVKKKWMTAISAVALAGSIFSTAAYAKENQGKGSLVALGDSITFGYNLGVNNAHPSKFAFPFIIGDEADLRVRDLGVPGWTTSQLLTSLKTDEQFKDAVRHAQDITLDIGSNDLLQAFADGNVYPEEIAPVMANLQNIILTIRSLTDAPIVVYNIYNPFQVADTNRHYMGDLLLKGINGQIQGLVYSFQDPNIKLADAYGAFGQNQAEYVRPNDIHPTIAGQKVLAKVGLEALGLEDDDR